MRNTIKIIIFLIPLLAGCRETDTAEARIKKDLNSRYTAFEIVEIRQDSSNIEQAMNRCRSLSIRAASNNSEIIQLIAKSYKTTDKVSLKEYYRQITLLDSSITKDCEAFESLRFNKSEKCYYVKYLVHKEERKIPVEEYFLIKENEVLHRPVEWTDFVYELEYDKVIEDVVKYYSEISNLEYTIKR